MRNALFLALGLVLPLAAQDKAVKPAEPAKAPSMAEMMPKPGPEMARMKAMHGTWDVEEIHEPNPFGPGGKGRGVGIVAPGPGGLSMTINYRSVGGHMKGFSGHGVLAWDEASKAYKQSWVDSWTTGLQVGTGNWDGETFVVNTETVMMGKQMKMRESFTKISKSGFTLTSEMSMDGGPFAKMMTLVHKRKMAAPAAAAEPAAK